MADNPITKTLNDLIVRNTCFMHVCGTHEWTITHAGLRDLLPENVKIVAGPGCPVCVIPAAEIDETIQLALEKNGVIILVSKMPRWYW
jgi:hydrogenase expression/formation protein HypD